MSQSGGFEFGKNWQQFLTLLNDQRRLIARQSIVDFLNMETLEGKSFIDIGCGSGLFSEAAYRLGAEKIISIDVDPFSIKCCRHLHQQAATPANWQVIHGSVLDKPFIQSLGQFDIVYSWGVLHHTGAMWQAMQHAISMMKNDGQFYISIYNHTRGWRGSKYWAWRKRIYCQSPSWIKRAVASAHWLYFLQSKLLRGKNPKRILREYQDKRGMDWQTDLIDWIGGYPYEYATVQEIFDFVHQHYPNLALSNLKSTDGLGTNSFLFKRLD